MKQLLTLIIAIASVTNATSQGTLLWNESVHGPLGETFATPTSLGLLFYGTNTVIGATEIEPTGSSWLVHEDYFRFQIPDGFQITRIDLFIDRPNCWLWFGTSNFGSQLGFTPNASSGSLLSQLGLQPIEPSSYGMYLANQDNQSSVSIANYRLDFVLTAVPEPGTWALLGLGSTLLWCANRRRRK